MLWGRRQFFRFLSFGLGGGLLNSAAADSQTEHHAKVAPANAFNDPDAIHAAFDVVIVGGGIAGLSAAISAARNGAKVALVHERSMLGGNSSSEVRLYPENSSGHHAWTRECGILDEIQTEERVRNHQPYQEGKMNAVWDLVLYEWVLREKNISLFLNTHMHRVLMHDATRIRAVYCIQLGSEKTFEFSAPLFMDCTGDGVLAHKAGAEYAWGREARSQYDEPLAPEQAEEKLMGSSLFFRAVDAGQPVPFKRPDWADEFPDESAFAGRSHSRIDCGYWWLEVGEPYHIIKDNNAVIHEGLRQLLGVWDHIKNKGDHGAENYGLEFVGFWPYKREARRILGDYVLTQQHLQDPQPLDDAVAYGVWFIDIHEPGGILKREQRPVPYAKEDANWDLRSARCYGIPLRALYSRNISNLMMAGRPISTSYVAFSSTRVLATGSIVGQAAGAAAALCAKYKTSPREVAAKHAQECRQLILRGDGHIPSVVNQDKSDLARQARATASSEAVLLFAPAAEERELTLPQAQIFPWQGGRLDTVELLLRSSAEIPIKMRLALRQAPAVWDFRLHESEAEAWATVPPQSEGWITFRFNKTLKREKLYCLCTDAHPCVFWKMGVENDEDLLHRAPVGVTAADLPGTRFWRPYLQGRSFCMRLTPETRPYSPANINRGTHRPDQWTNLWASDPGTPLPAWIELHWKRPLTFNTVQITFDTNANRLVRLPLFRYPECVRDYTLDAETHSGWSTLHEEQGNYLRRRVHRFDTIRSDRLRLNILATNGVPSARVYEIRVYNEEITA